jgi:iron-sulfur cluster assembly protein
VADVSGGKLFGIGLKAPQPAVPAPAPEAPAPVAAPAPRRSGIEIDASAAERIGGLLAARGTPGAGLRIRVKGGGCTGLTYDMEFAEAPREKDRTFEAHGVKIFVDPKSYIFLVGTTLSYHQGKLESGFKLQNPNAKQSCGCGESFTV